MRVMVSNIQYYVYTRSLDVDYRDLIVPSNASKDFLRETRGLIRTVLDNPDADLHKPKWVLLKSEDYVIWGVCCLNEVLANKQQTDCKNRPIRGFVGLYFECRDGEEPKLPYDLSYFIDVYNKVVEPLCETRHSESQYSASAIWDEYKYNTISAKYTSLCEKLNDNVFSCKSLGNVDREDAISAALTFSNISLLIDNDNLEQAIEEDENSNNRVAFMNCISSQITQKTVTVRRKCSVCGRIVHSYSYNQVCEECAEAAQKILDKEHDDMKYKEEAERLNRELRDKQFLIDDLSNKLLSKNRLLKVISILCGILLVALVFLAEKSCDSGNHRQQKASFEENIGNQPRHQNPQDDQLQKLYVSQDLFEIEASGANSNVLKWNKTVCPKISRPDVDWVRLTKQEEGMLEFCVDANTKNSHREAKFTLSTETDTQVITIAQKQL